MEPKVQFRYLSELPQTLRFLPFILVAPIKIIHQVLSILYTFFFEIPTPPEYIIVQVYFLNIVHTCAERVGRTLLAYPHLRWSGS
jgi:hypothetical protein